MAQSAPIGQHWEEVKAALRRQMSEASYSSWIAPLDFGSVDNDVVTLTAPSKFFSDSVETAYGAQIKEAWRRESPAVKRVVFNVQPSGERPPLTVIDGDGKSSGRGRVGARRNEEPVLRGAQEEAAAGASPAIPSPVARRRVPANPDRAAGPEPLQSISLNERFRFDTFVVGRPNEFAHAAAKRVSEDSTTPFNPLFLYGPSGLGKTHLLHSIAWKRKELFPDDEILFISAETFLVAFVSAVRQNSTIAFKEMLRGVDMLIVDDVQHIVGKESTQIEFFHTFNALADQHRQIVLSADCSPTDMDGLDDRLRSRLGWGLVADLHPTDYELRFGILQAKTEQALERTPGLQVDRKVLDFLAQRISTDVRTLEGALNRLFAIASMSNRPASIEMAQRELQDLLRHSDRKVSIEEIQRRVAEHYNIRLAEMFSPRRARSVARPRQVAMYLCKLLTQKSLPDIGRKFGGRDHTTVMHAVKKVTELRAVDSAFDDDVERLRRALEG